MRRLEESQLMSRCSSCNAAAFQRITHEQAAAHVNSKLLELVDEFWQCGRYLPWGAARGRVDQCICSK